MKLEAKKDNAFLIEQHLNRNSINIDTNFCFRVCFSDDRLFIWHRNTSPDYWLNIFAQEAFYFRSLDLKKQLIDMTRQYLQMKSDRKLGRLIGQITDFKHKVPKLHAISDLLRNHPRIQGETLHFLLDATNQDLKEAKEQISHIGKGSKKRGRILNPKFPQIEPLRTQLLASMICDGHLNIRRCLHYYEKNSDRLQIVKQFLAELGDVEFSEFVHSSGCTRINLPAILGRLLESWGMPIGDRAISNIGLPHTILNAENEIKRIYLQELIPEEGSFITRDSCFRWSRTIVLDAGAKAKRYFFTSKISQKHVKFISAFGNETQISFGKEDTRNVIRLIWGELKRLAGSEKKSLANDANKLCRIVLANPPKLLEDEVDLCSSLGIKIRYNPIVINLFDTGRVSVTWQATTASLTDGINWALQALPHDKRKRIQVMRFLAHIV